MKTYGERLKAIRLSLKMTQEAFALHLGYKRQGNLSLYENDKKRPSAKTVLRHAGGVGMRPSEFLADVIVTEYDRIKRGDYDDKLEAVWQPKKASGESQAPASAGRERTPQREQAS